MASAKPNLVLAGPRGAGKSCVGRIVAAKLGRAFVDTDERICAAAGKTVDALFAEEGEAGFRAREARAVEAAAALEGAVIALGGGAVENPENVRRLRARGVVCYLSAPAVVLFKRTAADPASPAGRPALTGLDPLQEMETMIRRRRPLYRSAAHFTVETAGKTPEEVAARVEAGFLRALRGEGPPSDG